MVEDSICIDIEVSKAGVLGRIWEPRATGVEASSKPSAGSSRWGLNEGGSVCVLVNVVVEGARTGIFTGGAVIWVDVGDADVVVLRNADGASEKAGL